MEGVSIIEGGGAMKTINDMNCQGFSRRRFLANTSALGAGSLLGLPQIASAEPPPETKKIRLVDSPAICLAPMYLAEDLLRLEGFSELEYVKATSEPGPKIMANGLVDIT